MNAPNELRTDAHLYLGLAEEKRSRSGKQFFASAMSLSPSARRCIVYSEMGMIAQFHRQLKAHANHTESNDSLVAAKMLITENRSLFSESDPWLEELLRQIARMERYR